MTRVLAAICALSLLACGGSTPKPTNARAAYDHAVMAALDGDAFAWRERMVRVAADHPDTPYGRAALAQLAGTGAGTIVALGILSAVAIPAFLKTVDDTRAAFDARASEPPLSAE